MKSANLLLLVPLVLFGLERVNLVRNASFEKEDSVWIVETGSAKTPNPAIGIAKDSTKSGSGLFSASSDTKEIPTWMDFFLRDSAAIRQRFLVPKTFSDLDSLCWKQAIVPRTLSPQSCCACLIGLTLADPERNGFGYGFKGLGFGLDYWIYISELITDDTTWFSFEKSLAVDFTDRFDSTQGVASFVLNGWGAWHDLYDWHGQKVYWDDIRLTGYADYDVGAKEILSADSVWAGVYYKPVARIKSFGRETADDFLAIAEIRQDETLVWADTIPYTLPADTEDTLEFDSFPVPDALSYTLTVRTEMYAPGAIDESDEDDEMSKPLYGTGITENPQPQTVTLEVESFTSSPYIYYSLPAGQSGTLAIYDASGRKMESLTVIGSGEVRMDALSSGVYFVKLEARGETITRKTIVLR